VTIKNYKHVKIYTAQKRLQFVISVSLICSCVGIFFAKPPDYDVQMGLEYLEKAADVILECQFLAFDF
jgi:hypothetical protein